jgi:prolyl-tRNA synthetase
VAKKSLDAAQQALLSAATEFRDSRVDQVHSVDEARQSCHAGRWARVRWSIVSGEGEHDLAASGITVRCLQDPDSGVPSDDQSDELVALLARAY